MKRSFAFFNNPPKLHREQQQQLQQQLHPKQNQPPDQNSYATVLLLKRSLNSKPISETICNIEPLLNSHISCQFRAKYIDAEATNYGDISCQSASCSFICIESDPSLDLARMRSLILQVYSISQKFKSVTVLFTLSQNVLPSTNDHPPTMKPYSNTLPLLAFQRALRSVWHTIQGEQASLGVLIPNPSVIPVSTPQDVLKIVQGICKSVLGLTESARGVSMMPGLERTHVLEDLGNFSGDHLLTLAPSLSLLSLLSGRPTPLNSAVCENLRTNFPSYSSISTANSRELLRSTKDKRVSAMVKQFFEEESL